MKTSRPVVPGTSINDLKKEPQRAARHRSTRIRGEGKGMFSGGVSYFVDR